MLAEPHQQPPTNELCQLDLEHHQLEINELLDEVANECAKSINTTAGDREPEGECTGGLTEEAEGVNIVSVVSKYETASCLALDNGSTTESSDPVNLSRWTEWKGGRFSNVEKQKKVSRWCAYSNSGYVFVISVRPGQQHNRPQQSMLMLLRGR